MAVYQPTPAQMQHYGALFDNTYRNADIPGNPQPTMSRDAFIQQQAAANPGKGQSDFDNERQAKQLQRSMQEVNQPWEDMKSIAAFPFKKMAGALGNYIGDAQTESEYYDQTGQQKSAQEIYAERDAQAQQEQQGVGNLSPQDVAEIDSQSLQSQAQKANHDTLQLQAKGATPVVNPKDDPVGALAAMNNNKLRGVGDAAGNVSPPPAPVPTQTQAQNMQLNQMGKQAMFDENKIPQWFDSTAFNMGLISFGLNLLDGNSLSTAFNSAGQTFGQLRGQEKRQIWAQDLAGQGYSPQEIQQWIETGDAKVLTDPMEKQAKQVALQTNLARLDQMQYENSPEMRQYQLGREQRKDALSEMQIRNSIANSNARLALAQKQFNMKLQAMQSDPEFGLDPKVARLVQNQVMPYLRDAQVKASRFDQSGEAARDALKAYDAGNLDEATSLYKGSREAFTKGYKGGYGGVNSKEIEEFSGAPAWLERYASNLRVGLTGHVSRDELVRHLQASEAASQAEHGAMKNYIQSQYHSLSAQIGPQRAQQVLNLTGSGAGIGQIVGAPANENTVELEQY